MKRKLIQLYYRLFPTYRRLEFRFVNYNTADRMIIESQNREESQQWRIAKEEDKNHIIGYCLIERRVRITGN